MGEHPPVSFSHTALENIQPPIGAGSPSMTRNSASANCFVSQGYSTNPNSNSKWQHPSLHEDPSFHSLIEKARSHNPSHRPNLLSIVLTLQQTVTRYFLYLSNLPLPAPASLSASLSLYLPRTPVKTPSPIMPTEDSPEHFACASGIPSPSRPTEPPYPHHPHLTRTTKVDFTSNTIENRSARDCRSTQARNHSHPPAPVSVPSGSGGADRANRSPLLASLAPNQYASTEHGRTGASSGAYKESLTLPPLRQSRAPTQGTAGTHHWTSPPVALGGA